jgi:signal transduction histidine kinase
MEQTLQEKNGADQLKLDQSTTEDHWLEIFSVLVHDIESPLASMKYLLRLLKEDRLDTRKPLHQKLVASTGVALERAESIIYDIMAIARSGQAGLPVQLETLAPDEIIEETILMASGSASERDISIVKGEGINGTRVTADPTLLRRSLDNLLYNAIRHTPSGGEIRLYATEEENSLFIHVKDSGPGLDDVDPEMLFEKYGQVKLRMEGRHRGVGLGLYFCKLAATGMGGTVVADDHPEGGAVFSIKLGKVKE